MVVVTRHALLRDPVTGLTVAVAPGDEIPRELAEAQVTNMDLFVLYDDE